MNFELPSTWYWLGNQVLTRMAVEGRCPKGIVYQTPEFKTLLGWLLCRGFAICDLNDDSKIVTGKYP
jgi:hypothetical protein